MKELSALDTPVVLVVYRRPKQTIKVFKQIARVRPRKLYLIADGPKPDKGEEEKCKKVREIVSVVDWPCNIKRIYAEKNMGSKYRVSSGIDNVFKHEEKAIILEDDCLPDITFFRYCQELLYKYENDERIYMISGYNPLGKYNHQKTSYFFSVQGTWGWATWRRAWKKFEIEIPKFSQVIYRNKMENFFNGNIKLIKDLEQGCLAVLEKGIDAWDYQWQFACAVNNGLTIYPSINLIKNIGFGTDATHTFNTKNILSKTELFSMSFPLIHNEHVQLDTKFIDQFYSHLEKNKTKRLYGSIARKLKIIKQ
ncbi:MAG: hypothetical protein JW894_02480 [Bacteroidales bacterium]|nr:hypothetical protein [Bacteroidales bacterium]